MANLQDMYMSEELVALNLTATSDLEALQKLAEVMLQAGVVKESFQEAIQKRERDFPTGLSLERIGVAIPHTDAVHVNKQAIAIGILKEPVEFRMMGGGEADTVAVKILFMLAIKDPHKQLEFLQALVNLMQNDQDILKLLELSTEKEIVSVFNSLLN